MIKNNKEQMRVTKKVGKATDLMQIITMIAVAVSTSVVEFSGPLSI